MNDFLPAISIPTADISALRSSSGVEKFKAAIIGIAKDVGFREASVFHELTEAETPEGRRRQDIFNLEVAYPDSHRYRVIVNDGDNPSSSIGQIKRDILKDYHWDTAAIRAKTSDEQLRRIMDKTALPPPPKGPTDYPVPFLEWMAGVLRSKGYEVKAAAGETRLAVDLPFSGRAKTVLWSCLPAYRDKTLTAGQLGRIIRDHRGWLASKPRVGQKTMKHIESVLKQEGYL